MEKSGGPGPGSGVVTSMNWVTVSSAGTRISGFRVGGTRSLASLPPQRQEGSAHSMPGKEKKGWASRKWRDGIKDSGKERRGGGGYTIMTRSDLYVFDDQERRDWSMGRQGEIRIRQGKERKLDYLACNRRHGKGGSSVCVCVCVGSLIGDKPGDCGFPLGEILLDLEVLFLLSVAWLGVKAEAQAEKCACVCAVSE